MGLVAVLYFLSGRLGLALATHDSHTTLIWPASGLALAAFLGWGPVVFPAVVLAAFAVNLPLGGPPLLSLIIGLGNAAGPWLGMVALRRLGFATNFARPRDAALFGLVGAVGAMVVPASVGVGALVATGAVPAPEALHAWLTWWQGDALGVMAVGPLALSLCARTPQSWTAGGPRREGAVAWALLLITTALALLGSPPGVPQVLPEHTLPFIVWLALRRRRFEAFWAVLVVALVLLGTAAATRPDDLRDHGESRLWTYLVSVSALNLLLLALRTQLARILSELQEKSVKLERAMEELTRSEHRFRVIAETGPQAIVVSDAAQRTQYVNPAFIKLFGYSLADMPSVEAWWPLAYPDAEYRETVKRRWNAAVEFAVRNRTSMPPQETVVTCRDGSVRHVEFRMASTGEENVILAYDLTARKEAEAAQRNTQHAFRQLVENLPVATILVDGCEVLYGNAEAARLTGFASPEQLTGQSILQFLQPERRELRLRAGPPMNGARAVIEERVLRRDGSEVVVEVTSVPTVFDGRQVQAMVAVDVSEKRAFTARMMQVDRMVAVGTLAAGVAHEINNPLSFILANLSYVQNALTSWSVHLRHAPGVTEQLREVLGALTDATEGAQRVRRIVSDLSTMSRKEGDRNVTRVEVQPVLESSLSMAAHELRHRAHLIKELAPVPPVRGDGHRLAQVFLNLLINAAHALPAGHAEEHRVTLRTRLVGDRVAVDIADTGCGIPENIRSRVFDPFFTTKPVGVGTGLGLSICDGIIRDMGGDISFVSTEGRGTTFTVTLPIAPEVGTAQDGSPADAAPPREPPKRKVLVVDDEPLIGKMLRRMLAKQDVTVFSSARKALAWLASTGEVDLVLCDVMMPELTGMEFLEHLRAAHPGLADRVVFMSGGAFTPEAQAFLQAPGRRCLAKPVEAQAVLELLEALPGPGVAAA